METNERPILYWIRGNAERGEEVINALEEKGGKNHKKRNGGDNKCVYFIDDRGVICAMQNDTQFAYCIMHYGTELTLPKKPKVLRWEDLDGEIKGYFSRYDGTVQRDEIGKDYAHDIFATKQQAKSAQAAAMISQICEQGKEVYVGDSAEI